MNWLSGALLLFYRIRRLRSLIRRVALRLEGGPLFSGTIRQLLRFHHGVVVGAYSYGDILRPGVLTPGSEAGAYCSVGCDLIVRRRDHPIDRISQSPLFYNRALGLLRRDTIQDDRDNPLTIGNDVWIGDRVTILSGCQHIGDGAVIAAGAVVTKNVPAYTIVGGVPAKRIRRRYSEETEARIKTSRWWSLSLSELLEFEHALQLPADTLGPDLLAKLKDRSNQSRQS